MASMTLGRVPSLKFGTHSTSDVVPKDSPRLTIFDSVVDHPDVGSILDLRVGDLLRRLGSSEPAPGGGAAAAVAGALGAALVQMTANLTIGRRQLAAVDGEARSIEARSADL